VIGAPSERLSLGWSRRRSQIHLVNWKIVHHPVFRGGLGIKKLMVFNKVFLGK
jgi:hypothetical protein